MALENFEQITRETFTQRQKMWQLQEKIKTLLSQGYHFHWSDDFTSLNIRRTNHNQDKTVLSERFA